MYIVHERCERGEHLINWSTSGAEDTVGKVRPLVTRVGGVMARLGGQGGPSSVIICMQPPSACTTQNSTNNQKTNIPEVQPSRSSFDIFCTFTFTNTLTLGINNFSFKFRFASRWGLEDNWTRESNDPSSKSPLSRKNILSKSTGLRSKLRIQLKLNTALLSYCPCVRVSVRHRRDISHFSHILRHKCNVNHQGTHIYSESKSSWLYF